MPRKKTWKGWTRKEEERLRLLRAEGKTRAQIAAELGRTLPSVTCRIGTLDAPKHSSRRRDWLHVITSGMTERQMAAAMGVTKWAVKRMKQRLKGKR